METFIFKSNDNTILNASRSGGIFTHLSDFVLNKNGTIYGAVLNKNFEVLHIRANSSTERNLMRGSKYVQSDLKETFLQVIEDLKNNKIVLFSGTACQIDGLLSLCKLKQINTQSLYTIDIICHGVPSPKIFKDYINWNEKKYGKKVINFNFRNKEKFGWEDHKETIYFSDSELDSKKYTLLFYSLYSTRPSCFSCGYKSLYRVSDLTIGDAWGVKEANSEYDDNKGTSLIILNTDKGKKIFDLINNNGKYKKVDIKDYMQKALSNSYEEPVGRKQFWSNIERFGINYYLNDNYLYKIKRKAISKLSNRKNSFDDKEIIINDYVPNLFLEKKDCCGCTACKNICPKNAISMKQDNEGFQYPVIDKDKCINCKLCLKVCRFDTKK